MSTEAEGQWHLDKRVPVAIIFAILVQSGSMIWWASNMNARVENLEADRTEAEAREQVTTRTVSEQGRDIAVMVSQMQETNRQLERLYAQVEATNALIREAITREQNP